MAQRQSAISRFARARSGPTLVLRNPRHVSRIFRSATRSAFCSAARVARCRRSIGRCTASPVTRGSEGSEAVSVGVVRGGGVVDRGRCAGGAGASVSSDGFGAVSRGGVAAGDEARGTAVLVGTLGSSRIAGSQSGRSDSDSVSRVWAGGSSAGRVRSAGGRVVTVAGAGVVDAAGGRAFGSAVATV